VKNKVRRTPRVAHTSRQFERVKKSTSPVIPSVARNLLLFVFKEIKQMLRFAQHDSPIFSHLREPWGREQPKQFPAPAGAAEAKTRMGTQSAAAPRLFRQA